MGGVSVPELVEAERYGTVVLSNHVDLSGFPRTSIVQIKTYRK
jgi:hypothetical protein